MDIYDMVSNSSFLVPPLLELCVGDEMIGCLCQVWNWYQIHDPQPKRVPGITRKW